MKKISLLGSTGSIGTQTLDIVRHQPDQFQVMAIAGGSNVDLLIDQALEFRPKLVVVGNEAHESKVKDALGPEFKVRSGEAGLIAAAAETEAELVVTAVVGSVGLRPTLAAIRAGKTIGLANKETLVTAGHLVTSEARKYGVSLLPIDSEHSAIYQCLQGNRAEDVQKIILTASGGSFRDRTREELAGVTVEQALNHPNWSMGAKITIDSATMMNKGLEVIEAHWLFGLPYDQIEVVIHPQSIIHSMVEYIDTSVIAQCGNPDMRVPIQYALTYPLRSASPAAPIKWHELGQLTFKLMDMQRYPCLRYAYECGKAGGTMPTVLNAANEIAVARFLRGEIHFLAIEKVIEQVLNAHHSMGQPSLEAIEEADAWARVTAGGIRA